MRKLTQLILLLFIPFVLSSCFEIREELSFTREGSGTYQLTMDFSQSRELLLLVMEAAEGEKINPFGIEGNPFHQVDSLFAVGSSQLKTISGITNPTPIKDDNNFQYGLKFNFDNVEALNTAISEIQYTPDGVPKYEQYYAFSKKRITKTGKFNLTSLIAQIKPDNKAGDYSAGLHKRIQQMYNSVSYKHIMRFGKVKRFSNDDNYRLINGKTTLLYSRTLKELQAGNVNIANEIKYK